MKKFYSILLTATFLITGCGQYSDIYYSCDGNWEIKKDFLGLGNFEVEKKYEILPFVVKFTYLGNAIQTIRGFNYYNTFQFNNEYWNNEGESITEAQISDEKIDVFTRNIRIVYSDEKNYKGSISFRQTAKTSDKLLTSTEQEFDLSRITGVIKYTLIQKKEFSYKSSQFIGQCKKIDKPI